MNVRYLNILSILICSTSFAEKTATIDTTTVEFQNVLNGCNQLTHREWIKRYSEMEEKVIDTLEKTPQLSLEKNKELFEVVFPQDLPKSHPMKGAFVGCFEIFYEYQKAISNVQSMSALKSLESCYRDAYKIDPPKVLGQYMDCLKKVKY